MSCKHVATCPLYPRLTSGAAIWKVKYCDGLSYRACERYRCLREGRDVPPNLLPNGDSLVSLDKHRVPEIGVYG